MYRLVRCKMVVGKKFLCSTGNTVWYSLMTWRDGMEEERGDREGGDLYTIMADLHGHVTNQQNTVNFFFNLKF